MEMLRDVLLCPLGTVSVEAYQQDLFSLCMMPQLLVPFIQYVMLSKNKQLKKLLH